MHPSRHDIYVVVLRGNAFVITLTDLAHVDEFWVLEVCDGL